MQAQHIFLTGFMGSGKSVLGKKLAELSGLGFIDLDEHIERREKRTIAAIFKQEGEDGFRRLEKKYLQQLVPEATSVISLGGGTVCFENNLDLVRRSGLLVYLELNPATLAQRLSQSKRKRPLLANVPEGELEQRIRLLLNTRRAFYEQAHIKVNGLHLTAPKLYEQILAFKQIHLFN